MMCPQQLLAPRWVLTRGRPPRQPVRHESPADLASAWHAPWEPPAAEGGAAVGSVSLSAPGTVLSTARRRSRARTQPVAPSSCAPGQAGCLTACQGLRLLPAEHRAAPLRGGTRLRTDWRPCRQARRRHRGARRLQTPFLPDLAAGGNSSHLQQSSRSSKSFGAARGRGKGGGAGGLCAASSPPKANMGRLYPYKLVPTRDAAPSRSSAPNVPDCRTYLGCGPMNISHDERQLNVAPGPKGSCLLRLTATRRWVAQPFAGAGRG